MASEAAMSEAEEEMFQSAGGACDGDDRQPLLTAEERCGRCASCGQFCCSVQYPPAYTAETASGFTPQGSARPQELPKLDKAAFKFVFGVAFYPEKVKELAEVLAERVPHEKLKDAYCVGPVMHLSTWMPLVYSGLACLVASTTALLCTCSEGEELKWPYWLWFLWLPVGLTLLGVEYYILRHLSVPYYIKAGGWKSAPTEFVDALSTISSEAPWPRWEHLKSEWGFALWLVWCLGQSGVRTVSFFSANMFIGMVLGDAWVKGKGCEAGTVETVWHHSLQGSQSWVLPSETTLVSIFAFMFLAQILHFLFGVLHAWPRPGQWYEGGRKPEAKRHPSASDFYEQDFELDIIEHISWRKDDQRRPQGNRFSYVTLFGTEVTSSAAVDTCAEACGQAGIVKTGDRVFDKYIKVARAIAAAQPENRPNCEDIRLTVVEMRALIQDARVVLRTFLSHILLYGVGFSGLVLQAQVTYFHARCFKDTEEGVVAMSCQDTSGLWVGVAAGFLTVSLTFVKAIKVLKYVMNVRSVKHQYTAWHPNHDSFICSDTQDCGPKHRQVLESTRGLELYMCLIVPAVALFVTNFAWVAMKYYMAQFVCKDHIWDVYFPPAEGCVRITVGSP